MSNLGSLPDSLGTVQLLAEILKDTKKGKEVLANVAEQLTTAKSLFDQAREAQVQAAADKRDAEAILKRVEMAKAEIEEKGRALSSREADHQEINNRMSELMHMIGKLNG